MATDFPKSPDPDKIDATQPISSSTPAPVPERGKFASYMGKAEGGGLTPQTGAPTGPTPLQANVPPSAPPTIQSIQTQMTSASSSLGDIKNQLHSKDLKLKQSQKYLVRNKLTSANQNIRSAAERSGVDTGEPVDLSSKKNPIAKFLDLVADGQRQLKSAQDMVQELNASGKSINPGQLLLIQAKLQKAQQELDYTSVILGKAVDTIKTFFNIQI